MRAIEVYPDTRFRIPYIIRDLDDNLISEDLWKDVESDVITFRLYLEEDRFLAQEKIEDYTEGDNEGRKVTFTSISDTFTIDDIGKVFVPQVTVFRNGEIVDDEELPRSELRLTIGNPNRLRK